MGGLRPVYFDFPENSRFLYKRQIFRGINGELFISYLPTSSLELIDISTTVISRLDEIFGSDNRYVEGNAVTYRGEVEVTYSEMLFNNQLTVYGEPEKVVRALDKIFSLIPDKQIEEIRDVVKEFASIPTVKSVKANTNFEEGTVKAYGDDFQLTVNTSGLVLRGKGKKGLLRTIKEAGFITGANFLVRVIEKPISSGYIVRFETSERIIPIGRDASLDYVSVTDEANKFTVRFASYGIISSGDRVVSSFEMAKELAEELMPELFGKADITLSETHYVDRGEMEVIARALKEMFAPVIEYDLNGVSVLVMDSSIKIKFADGTLLENALFRRGRDNRILFLRSSKKPDSRSIFLAFKILSGLLPADVEDDLYRCAVIMSSFIPSMNICSIAMEDGVPKIELNGTDVRDIAGLTLPLYEIDYAQVVISKHSSLIKKRDSAITTKQAVIAVDELIHDVVSVPIRDPPQSGNVYILSDGTIISTDLEIKTVGRVVIGGGSS